MEKNDSPRKNSYVHVNREKNFQIEIIAEKAQDDKGIYV
jgi:hypothetical protein